MDVQSAKSTATLANANREIARAVVSLIVGVAVTCLTGSGLAGGVALVGVYAISHLDKVPWARFGSGLKELTMSEKDRMMAADIARFGNDNQWINPIGKEVSANRGQKFTAFAALTKSSESWGDTAVQTAYAHFLDATLQDAQVALDAVSHLDVTLQATNISEDSFQLFGAIQDAIAIGVEGKYCTSASDPNQKEGWVSLTEHASLPEGCSEKIKQFQEKIQPILDVYPENRVVEAWDRAMARVS